jgi:hypothetical protein
MGTWSSKVDPYVLKIEDDDLSNDLRSRSKDFGSQQTGPQSQRRGSEIHRGSMKEVSKRVRMSVCVCVCLCVYLFACVWVVVGDEGGLVTKYSLQYFTLLYFLTQ